MTSVLVTIPDNPTGTIASPDVVRRLCEVARDEHLVVISDEIYLDLVHDESLDVLTPGQVLPEQTVTTTGLSKSLALGGWRIGVARFPNSPSGQSLRDHVLKEASEIWSAPAQPVQHVAAWALAEPSELHDHLARSRRLHGTVARAVADVFRLHGAQVPAPAGGFYLYPDFSAHLEQLEQDHASARALSWRPLCSTCTVSPPCRDQPSATTPCGSPFGSRHR